MKQSKIFYTLLCATTLSLTSCLKEHDMIIIDASKSTDVVAFGYTESNQASATSQYPGFYKDLGSLNLGESATFNINLQYTGANDAPNDVTIGLALDTAALTQYNAENGTSYEVPAASIFSFPTSVVIKQGTRSAQVTATITNTADFDFGKSYALPLAITTTSAGNVSSNSGKAIYSFGLRNIYDGHYSFKGYALRGGDPALTGNFNDDHGMDLITVGANIVQFGTLQVWGSLSGVGIGNPAFTINSDNTVTVNSSGGAYNAPGYNSRYEPSEKTFYVSFTWGAGPAARLAIDTLTYIGPRN